MIDTGAMVSVISTALANHCGIVEEGRRNVLVSGFRVRGIGDTLSGAAIVDTELDFGMKATPERSFRVQLCALESSAYKLVIGLDILEPLHAQIDLENYKIRIKD